MSRGTGNGTVLYVIYACLNGLFYPFIWLWALAYRRCFPRVKRARALQRLGFSEGRAPEGTVIWVHGVSVGESLSAKTLIQHILHEHPKVVVVLTVGTKTAWEMWDKFLREAEWKAFGGRIFVRAAPFGWPLCVRRFVNFWRPQLFLVLEGDFWPSFFFATYKRSVPTVLLNAVISKKSVQRWRRFGASLLRRCFRGVQACLVPTEAQKRNFQAFGIKNCVVAGSLKWAVAPRETQALSAETTGFLAQREQKWVAASTHAGEEAIILEAHQAVLKKYPESLLVLVPRHIERSSVIFYEASQRGLKVRCLTDLSVRWSLEGCAVLLVNEMGCLPDFFKQVPVVLMAGSLLPGIGGHNLIEPAQHGCALLHGPFMEKNRSVMQAFDQIGAARTVENAADLGQRLLGLFSDPSDIQQMGETGKRLTEEKQTQVLARYLENLAPFIKRCV